MPFMRADNPIRRTLFHLKQGKIFLRDQVGVLIVGLNESLPEKQRPSGLSEFLYWHWAQLQFNNPNVHLVRLNNTCITPYVQAFLKDGRETMLDVEGMGKDEIGDLIQKTLGKSALVRKREYLELVQKTNPAEFGEHCERQCICEVQGQVPCPHLLWLPSYLKGEWKRGRGIART